MASKLTTCSDYHDHVQSPGIVFKFIGLLHSFLMTLLLYLLIVNNKIIYIGSII